MYPNDCIRVHRLIFDKLKNNYCMLFESQPKSYSNVEMKSVINDC